MWPCFNEVVLCLGCVGGVSRVCVTEHFALHPGALWQQRSHPAFVSSRYFKSQPRHIDADLKTICGSWTNIKLAFYERGLAAVCRGNTDTPPQLSLCMCPVDIQAQSDRGLSGENHKLIWCETCSDNSKYASVDEYFSRYAVVTWGVQDAIKLCTFIIQPHIYWAELHLRHWSSSSMISFFLVFSYSLGRLALKWQQLITGGHQLL